MMNTKDKTTDKNTFDASVTIEGENPLSNLNNKTLADHAESVENLVDDLYHKAIDIVTGNEQPQSIPMEQETNTKVAGSVQEPPEYTASEIKTIRQNLNATPERFAELLNTTEETVEAWEKSEQEPSAASRKLLYVADKHPEALLA